MKRSMMCSIAALCGLTSAAMAQPRAVYSWSVIYGNLTSEPTATAAGVFTAIPSSFAIGMNGATHARLRVSMSLQNITIGCPFCTIPSGTVLPAIGGGAGEAYGLFYSTFDLVSAEPNANQGTLSRGWIRNNPLRPTSSPGILPPTPGSVNGIGAVQLVQQPGLANPSVLSSFFPDFWEVFWSTSDLTARTVTFTQALPAFASGPNAGPTQLILNVDPDPLNNFTPGFGMLATNYAPVSVVVVPAPGVAAAMGLGGVVVLRRRRT